MPGIPNRYMTHWRRHPDLQGKLHPEYPDDLQVVIHDGGLRFSDRRPEAVWVRISDNRGDVFAGQVLNAPAQLKSVRQGQTILFLARTGTEHALMVTEKYLMERPAWEIGPCDRCGLAELFDAPSDLLRVAFPNLPAGAALETFTSFCPLCGGVQVLQARSAP
ncbi:MAG TPA: hypothetical protein VG734_04145 [Lacunisphaera sp.]|nr:hypothetical protein [Lacunisphaera sp.]